ncbi:MAG: hypothetical protein SFU86_14300 [Pirellulaceae bacterium]|nr:hypothetical protein [Pirellulaceae bacterium]
MFATRYQPAVGWELLKWMVLLLLAFAMFLALAAVAAAEEPRNAPALLPDDMGEVAVPMPPVFPEPRPADELPACEVAARLWMILEHHRAGCFGDALAGWGQLDLPAETAVWQHIARAAALLEAGDHAQVIVELDLARRLNERHPVVAYYTGLLRLEQAAAAERLPDVPELGNIRLVAAVPRPGTEARQIYERLARHELQQAIAHAGDVLLDQPLVTTAGDPAVNMPCVGDLLVALRADNFVAKAHHLLFALELDRGELRAAEDHLDAAVAMGLTPLFGYEDLAQAYHEIGDEAGVLRVGQKDLRIRFPALWEACRQLEDAWRQTWDEMVW